MVCVVVGDDSDLVHVTEAMYQCIVVRRQVCCVRGWAAGMAYLTSREGLGYARAFDKMKSVRPTGPEVDRVKKFVETVVEGRKGGIGHEDLAALVAAVALLPARQRGVLLQDLRAMDF